MGKIPMYSPLERILLPTYGLVFYLIKLFAPFNLSPIYSFPEVSNGWLPVEYYLSFPIVLALIWIIYKSGQYRKDIVFGFLFYIITIGPMLMFVPIGRAIVADRYTYLPYLGLFFIIVKIYSFIPKHKSNFLSLIFYGYTILFSFLSWERIKI